MYFAVESLYLFPIQSTRRLSIFIFSLNKSGRQCKTETSLRLYFNKVATWWNYFRFALGSDLSEVFSPTASFSVLILLDFLNQNLLMQLLRKAVNQKWHLQLFSVLSMVPFLQASVSQTFKCIYFFLKETTPPTQNIFTNCKSWDG